MSNKDLPGDRPYLWWDFLGIDRTDRAILDSRWTLDDIAKQRVTLCDGMQLTLWERDHDEHGQREFMLIDGVASFDEQHQRWVANVDYESFRRIPYTDAPWLDDFGSKFGGDSDGSNGERR